MADGTRKAGIEFITKGFAQAQAQIASLNSALDSGKVIVNNWAKSFVAAANSQNVMAREHTKLQKIEADAIKTEKQLAIEQERTKQVTRNLVKAQTEKAVAQARIAVFYNQSVIAEKKAQAETEKTARVTAKATLEEKKAATAIEQKSLEEKKAKTVIEQKSLEEKKAETVVAKSTLETKKAATELGKENTAIAKAILEKKKYLVEQEKTKQSTANFYKEQQKTKTAMEENAKSANNAAIAQTRLAIAQERTAQTKMLTETHLQEFQRLNTLLEAGIIDAQQFTQALNSIKMPALQSTSTNTTFGGSYTYALRGVISNFGDVQNSLGYLMSAFAVFEKIPTAVIAPITLALGALSVVGGMAAKTFQFLANVVIGVVKAAFNIATTAINLFIGAIKTAINFVGKIINVAKSLLQTLYNMTLGPVVNIFKQIFPYTAGQLFADVIRTITQRLKDLSQQIIQAASDFQVLEIRFQAIAARSISEEIGVSIADAYKVAAPAAKDLLNWVRQIAVTTPFTAQSLADTVALANALGMSVDMAKAFTLAAGNLTAAMGLSSETMERIIYNTGQMLEQGKMTGREFRDLAVNLVPVYDILDRIAKKYNVTTEAARDMAMTGQIPVTEFIQEFINYVNESFPGAMEKLSQTFVNVQNNLKDFIQLILGVEVIGPTFNDITAEMAKSLQSLMQPENVKKFHEVGQYIYEGYLIIKRAFNELIPVLGEFSQLLLKAFGIKIEGTALSNVEKIIAAITFAIQRGLKSVKDFLSKNGNAIADWVVNFIPKMRAWGANLITSFANGMASAVKAIINVIDKIARIITSLLKGKSPPPILPDLTKWGKAAMEAWLYGWQQADWSVFNSIAKNIERFMRSLAKDKDTKLIPSIIAMRTSLAKFLESIRNGLTASQEAIDRFVKSIRGLTPEFSRYIMAAIKEAQAAREVAAAQEKVAEADKKVKAAQDELNNATDQYDGILDSLNKRLQTLQNIQKEQEENKTIAAYQKVLASGKLTAGEKTRVSAALEELQLTRQIRAVEAQKTATLSLLEQNLKLAQSKKDQLQIELDLAQAREDAAKKELEAAQAMLDFQQELIDLMKEQRDLLESIKEAAKSGGGSDTGAGGGGGDPLEKLRTDAEIALANLQSISDYWKSGNDMFTLGNGKFKEMWEPLLVSSGNGGGNDNSISGLLRGMLDDIEEAVNGPDGLVKKVEGGAKSVQNAFDGIANEFKNVVLPDVLEAGGAILDLLLGSSQTGAPMFDPNSGVPQGMSTGRGGGLVGAVASLYDWFVKVASGIDFEKLSKDLRIFLTITIPNIITKVGEWAELMKSIGEVFLALSIWTMSGDLRDLFTLLEKYANAINKLFDLWRGPGKASGGPVSANTPYVVGEVGPELFIPRESGTIIPYSQITNAMSAALASQSMSYPAFAPSGFASAMTTYSRQVNISVNPIYSNVQSPASIYWDVSAAVSAAMR